MNFRNCGLFLFSLFCLLLSSCFDIVEDITLTAGGSGSIKATVNLSKSKTKVASLMKLNQVEGIKVPKPAEIRKQMGDIVTILKRTPGISNVKQTLDLNNFIASISCNFTSVNALNAFSSALSKHFKVNVNGYSNYTFDPKTQHFERKYSYNPQTKKKLNQLSPQSKSSFKDAFYSVIYRFEKPIKTVSNAHAKISSNKKASMMKVSAIQLAEGQVNLSNKILLSN